MHGCRLRVDGKTIFAAHPFTVDRHHFQRLQNVVKPVKAALIAGFGNEKNPQARPGLFGEMHEGRLVMIKLDQRHWQGNFNASFGLGNGLEPKFCLIHLIIGDQGQPLRCGQNACRLEPVHALPFGHGIARARSKGSINRGCVKPVPTKRRLQCLALVACQVCLGCFGLPHRLIWHVCLIWPVCLIWHVCRFKWNQRFCRNCRIRIANLPHRPKLLAVIAAIGDKAVVGDHVLAFQIENTPHCRIRRIGAKGYGIPA